jgi:tetratricopeptide (TPR) repeat protein
MITEFSKLLPFACALACALATPACVKSPGAVLDERMRIMKQAQDPESLVVKARGFASIGDYTRAEQYLNLAVQSGADEARLLPLLINVCVRDQRYRDAIQHAENHLRRHPERHAVRFLLATLQMGVGDAERARGQLEKVLSARPDYAEAHYALAVVLRDDMGHLSRADEHFRAYLRLTPEGRHAEEARGSLLEVVP